jgi:hypothetical protein
VPFRDSSPRSFISPPPPPGGNVTAGNATGNATGSLREQCVIIGLIDADDEAATVAADARARHFSPEQVMVMLAAEAEYHTTADAVLDAMAGEGAAELNEPGCPLVNETADERAATAVTFDSDDAPPPP